MQKSRVKISRTQTLKMVDLLEAHPNMLKTKFSSEYTKDNRSEDWDLLTQQLNAECGARKTTNQWNRAWQDLKLKTRKRAEKCRTGDGLSEIEPLTPFEKRILALIAEETVTSSPVAVEPRVWQDLQPKTKSVPNKRSSTIEPLTPIDKRVLALSNIAVFGLPNVSESRIGPPTLVPCASATPSVPHAETNTSLLTPYTITLVNLEPIHQPIKIEVPSSPVQSAPSAETNCSQLTPHTSTLVSSEPIHQPIKLEVPSSPVQSAPHAETNCSLLTPHTSTLVNLEPTHHPVKIELPSSPVPSAPHAETNDSHTSSLMVSDHTTPPNEIEMSSSPVPSASHVETNDSLHTPHTSSLMDLEHTTPPNEIEMPSTDNLPSTHIDTSSAPGNIETPTQQQQLANTQQNVDNALEHSRGSVRRKNRGNQLLKLQQQQADALERIATSLESRAEIQKQHLAVEQERNEIFRNFVNILAELKNNFKNS